MRHPDRRPPPELRGEVLVTDERTVLPVPHIGLAIRRTLRHWGLVPRDPEPEDRQPA